MTTSVRISRLINIAALFALIGVLGGSLHLQFGIGEQPCPLCLVQRSAMFGLAVGPTLNLLWGIKARHYALSILAALVGAAGSTRQILLHIAPGDAGYGPAVAGLHLYTWALVTFVVAIAGCAVMLLWQAPLAANDEGVGGAHPFVRVGTYTAIIWMIAWAFTDLIVVAIAVVPECGLGMCPDDPAPITGLGDGLGWLAIAAIGAAALVIAILIERRRARR